MEDLEVIKDSWLSKAKLFEEDLEKERKLTESLHEQKAIRLKEMEADKDQLVATICSLKELVENTKIECSNLKEQMDNDKQISNELAHDATELREKLNEQIMINSNNEQDNVNNINQLNIKIAELKSNIKAFEKEEEREIEKHDRIA